MYRREVGRGDWGGGGLFVVNNLWWPHYLDLVNAQSRHTRCAHTYRKLIFTSARLINNKLWVWWLEMTHRPACAVEIMCHDDSEVHSPCKRHTFTLHLNGCLSRDTLLLDDGYNTSNMCSSARGWRFRSVTSLSVCVCVCVSESVCECTWSGLGPPRKWLHPVAMYRILPCWRREQLHSHSFSICPPQKTPLFPSELKRVMKLAVGAEAGVVGVGPLPKTTRRRGCQTEHLCAARSLLLEPCPSLTAPYEKPSNMTQKNTPNCQRAQRTQWFKAIWYSIFGAVCELANRGQFSSPF